MTTFVFRVRNVPAALYKALGGFATNGVNMTKLESYMMAGQFVATQFLCDADGHPEQPALRRALEELSFFSSRSAGAGGVPGGAVPAGAGRGGVGGSVRRSAAVPQQTRGGLAGGTPTEATRKRPASLSPGRAEPGTLYFAGSGGRARHGDPQRHELQGLGSSGNVRRALSDCEQQESDRGSGKASDFAARPALVEERDAEHRGDHEPHLRNRHDDAGLSVRNPCGRNKNGCEKYAGGRAGMHGKPRRQP